jgi:hypothetical protein
MRIMMIAAVLAALAVPAAAPADASHRDRWEQRDGSRHWRGDRRWDRRDWRGDRRWRGHRGWRGHGWRAPPRRYACRSVWWDGWTWRCRW